MYENTTFAEYMDLMFQGFENNIKLNIENGDSADLAQCRTLVTISTIYTTRESFESMSDDELKHYVRFSLPENVDLLKERFCEIITESHAIPMVDIIIQTIGNQHQFALDLMMLRYMEKKLEDVNKMVEELAAEKGIQLLEA